MSRQFSIFTKAVALLLILAISMAFMQEAQAYHCKELEDKFWDEFWEQVEKGALAAILCSPPSLKTGVGIAACAVALASYSRQAQKTRLANLKWQNCENEHQPN